VVWASRRFVLAVAAVGLLAACSGGSESADVTIASGQVIPGEVNDPPRVELIAEAIAAIEAELGGPQEYFEINATPRLVNLFVALNNGAVVQPWVYFDGSLTSKEGQSAQGNVFTADSVDFDADTVLARVTEELPMSVLDAFIIEGGAGGRVRYSVVVSSLGGGQLVVVVDPSGLVLSVDPV
jgi:hypothetical protein